MLQARQKIFYAILFSIHIIHLICGATSLVIGLLFLTDHKNSRFEHLSVTAGVPFTCDGLLMAVLGFFGFAQMYINYGRPIQLSHLIFLFAAIITIPVFVWLVIIYGSTIIQ